MTDTYDDDEKDMLKSFLRGEWASVKNVTDEKDRYQKAARASMKKDKRVNIRLSSHDLEAIQRLAIEEGLPYQTLLSSIIHRYATGRLIPRRNRRNFFLSVSKFSSSIYRYSERASSLSLVRLKPRSLASFALNYQQ